MRGNRETRFEDREFLSQSSWEHEPSTQDQLPVQRPITMSLKTSAPPTLRQ